MVWIVTTDRNGNRHHVNAQGSIIWTAGNFGRMRWTVQYPDGDYGMTDTLGEAKAWASLV